MTENNKNKIPKIIHYCWFGYNPKNDLILKCIESWKKYLPDYKIIEWNEDNFDVNYHPYTKEAYENKKWAFVSDIARLKILYTQGGVYLDTDMFILKNVDELLIYDCFVCREDKNFINAAVLGSVPDNIYIRDLLETYNYLNERETIPRVMTRIYNQNKNKYSNLKVLDSIYFYPFTINTIKNFDYKNAPNESYGVHMWDYSWGHPLNKFMKKIGLHSTLVKITEVLGVKKIAKKILKME